MPGVHRLLQAKRRLVLMRHEFVKLVWPLAVRVGVESGQQSRASLHAHAKVQAAALGPVLLPAQELRVAQPLLCFSDGATTDSTQHQLVPELV